MTDLDRLDVPEGECGFNEWHEPHGYVVAEGGAAAEYECPGLTAPDPTTIRSLVAAVRERDDLRAGLDETQRFLEYLWSATGNRAPDLPVHDLFNEDDPIADDILTVLGRARMLVHGATPAALHHEDGAS